MTINLPLEPQEEARLVALAEAKGLSADEFVRAALEQILAEGEDLRIRSAGLPTGSDLIAAMQASPYREIDLEPGRTRLPVRDVSF